MRRRVARGHSSKRCPECSFLSVRIIDRFEFTQRERCDGALSTTVRISGCDSAFGGSVRGRHAAAGPVTIETEIDFSTEPFHGTFQVTEGAEVLGCSSGTFVDTPGDDDIQKDFTCEKGSKEGNFIAVFVPNPETPGPGDENGPWSISVGTEDFAGLIGEGDFSVVYAPDDAPRGVETLTGDIEYTS